MVDFALLVFLMVLLIGLQIVVVVFPSYTHDHRNVVEVGLIKYAVQAKNDTK